MDIPALLHFGGLMLFYGLAMAGYGAICAVVILAGSCPHCRRERRARAKVGD